MRHHIDRVHRLCATCVIFLHSRDAAHHFLRELVRALRPGINNLVVFLALRDETIIELLLVIFHERACFTDDLRFGVRNDHVVFAEGNTSFERIGEPECHDAIAEDYGLFLTTMTIDRVNRVRDFFLRHQLVDDVKSDLAILRQKLTEHRATRRCVIDFRVGFATLINTLIAIFDLGVNGHRT